VNSSWGLKGPGLSQGDAAEEHGDVAPTKAGPPLFRHVLALPLVPVTTLTTASGNEGEVNCFLTLLLCCLEAAGVQIKIRLSLQQQERWLPVTKLAKMTEKT